jgi:FlaA1/EpsC-like NDP-sugar epimerase
MARFQIVFVPIQLEICIKHHGFGESMSVLVTGGAGYIGSHMVHELAEADEGIVFHVR